MGAWHSRVQKGTMNSQMQISILQIANIKAAIDDFLAEDDAGPSLSPM